jgi:hypothetical protein
MVFRIPDEIKTPMRITMMKHHIKVQDTFQAFAEAMNSYDRDGKSPPDLMKSIIKRAQALST